MFVLRECTPSWQRARLGGVIVALAVMMAACGSSGEGGSSTGSSSSSSTSSSSASSSSSGKVAIVSTESALDWDWTEQASAYCADHQQESTVAGSFEVLRPGSSKYLHSSEHFVMRWNDADNVNISQETIDSALNTFETVWRFYIDELNFPEPYGDTATKYKVSVNVSDQGYASGAGTGLRDPEMWVHFDALGHVGTLAHEFAHTLQHTTRSMRDSKFVGWLWESHANWMAHQFNPDDVQCTEALVNAPHIYYGSTRNRYCNWHFFEFIKDNSCHEFLNDALWKNGVQPEDSAHWNADPFTTLADNAGWSDSQLNDIFADWALHNVHWDYQDNGDTYRNKYGSNFDIEGARRFRVTRLLSTGVQNEYEVANYWAPQRWGYNLVELSPTKGSEYLNIEFNGLVQDSSAVSALPSGAKLQPEDITEPDSSWRWSVVVTQADGSARYSEIQRGREAQLRVDLKADDKAVWLVVMATPEKIQKIFWDQIYYSIYRYPWQITLEGATPVMFQGSPVGSGAEHANGGGWVAESASVSAGAYIGENAKVMGSATVLGNARIEGRAVVEGRAHISGSAVVRDNAWVSGAAVVKDDAIIEGHASISGGAVQGRARVGALTMFSGQRVLIDDDAVVLTTMNTISNGRSVTGTAQVIGDVELNTSVDRGVFYGFVDTGTITDTELGADRVESVDEVTRQSH